MIKGGEMSFNFTETAIEGLVIIEPHVFHDQRGFFLETYKKSEFRDHGIYAVFVQDNHSCSHKGILRGLHFQREPFAQGKLVRVIYGSVWDVAVDIRPGSSTYGRWFGLELNDENHYMIFIPAGFAHGFVTLSEKAEFEYKCTCEYNKESEGGIRWDDPDIDIKWPNRDVKVSEKDKLLPYMKDGI